MKEKLAQFFQNFKKYLKATLIVLLIIGILSILGFIYIFKDYIYNNDFISKFFKENNPVAINIESVNNKIINEESVVINVVEKAGDSVVSIVYLDDIFEDEGTPIGSGVIVSSDGLIVTNKHVIDDENASYEVALQDGTRYKVIEVIRDKAKDLALIKVGATNLKAVNLGNSENLKLGQKAIAVGTALGLSNTVSVGIISGLKREVEIEGEMFRNLIQTDAAINPGNSGGALLNSNGDLVGINTARSSYAENIGFAIPVKSVTDLIERFKSGEIDKDSVPAFLGIGFAFRDLKDYVNRGLPIGPVITGVLKNSPADKSGLRVGDIIVSIDGVEFSDEYELSEFIKQKNPGDTIKIKIYRKNGTLDIDATLGESVN